MSPRVCRSNKTNTPALQGANFPTAIADTDAAIADLYPLLSPATLRALLAHYPPAAFRSEAERFATFIADSTFDSNRHAVSAALPRRTYNMVNKGRHGDGTNMVFNDLPSALSGYGPEVVDAMRRCVMNFVVTGNPNGAKGVADGVVWPVYGEGRGLVVDGAGMKVGDVAARREAWKWWAKGMTIA